MEELASVKKWPCFFFKTDTTGEKDFEEFYTESEQVDWDRYAEIGVVRNDALAAPEDLDRFVETISRLRDRRSWSKAELLEAFAALLPHFAHKETGRNLDNRM